MAGRSERKRGRRCDGRNGNNSIPFASHSASSTPSQRSLSRTLSSFPLNSPSSPVPCRRTITSPPPLLAMLHFHNASLSRSLHPIFPPFPPASSFPCSSFLTRCFSVLLSLCLSTLLGVRSILSQPHSEAHPGHHKPAPNFDCLRLDLSLFFFLMCFVLTAFFIAATDGPFLPGVRVRTMRIGMRFPAAPYLPHDTPCQHSSISISVAHLWCSVVRHRHPGTGHVTLLCHVRRRLVFSGELHCSFTCAAMRCSSDLMLCRLPWL